MQNLRSKLPSFWSFCVGGAIVGAVTSQSMLDFFSTLLFLGIVRDYFKDKSGTLEKFKWLGIEWAIICYIIVIILGYIFNASPEAEHGRHLFKFMWVPTLFIFIYSLSKIEFTITKILSYFGLAFLIPNIYTVESYISGTDILTQKTIIRAVGMVGSATYHAHSNAIVFVVYCAFIYFSFGKINKHLKALSLAAATLFFFSIFITMTRGVWFSLLASASCMYGLISYKKTLKILAVVAVLFVIAFTTWPGFRQRLNIAHKLNSPSERVTLLNVNFQMWGEYPWLGIGYGENQRRNREYWDRPEWNMPEDYIISHAHNQLVNVMATTGVIGLFFFLFIFIFFVKKNWQMLQNEKDKNSLRYMMIFACMWGQVEFIFSCMSDITFEYAKIRTLFLFVWAALIALERGTLKLKETGLNNES